MKKLYKTICFAIWMYFNLRHLRGFHYKIKHFREAGDAVKEREQILNATTTWGKGIMKKYKIKLTVTGLENVPEGPVVFVSNHQGYADIPVYGAAITTKQIGFVARISLGQIPVFGEWIRDIRSVFIQRDDPRASLKTIEEGIELLKQGFSLVIFPEGTRSRGPEMGEFKKGSLRLATKPGVPVVPVTLNGTYHVYEDKGYVHPGASVEFYIHPAIETKDMPKTEANNLAEKVEEIIKTKLTEMNSQQ
ncbi:lysophospholipid acyltransferase family protein [Sinanaerobacter chloroacetimidivorans]|uniref:1-acyl-sn-glycerol-3-phosphate acyltransferase n=1 Tax=Sinanaerobacter chloroacetimidivorans TaxID=2818044 RepID=A0A8J8B1M2_9FIRM|nr:lysophospholipid acyltransferase family protein [Sinanaerobacter chloroacetimidivorans]MBR0598389.1 1-acyl-sn-glycerol-3-phosphate acyltransferase [Sinanaerobacter chloroacetimidivorans]